MEHTQQIDAALNLARSGQYEEAGNICQELIAHQPQNHQAWHLSGVLHNLSGRPKDGLECIKQAIAIEPGIAKYHLNLGNACLALGNVPAARAAYEQALALDGNYQDAHYNLALLLKPEDAKKAEIHFQSAVRGPAPMPDAWAELAHLQETENRLAEAAQSVASGLALAPQDPLLRVVEAKLLRRKQQPAAALDRLSSLPSANMRPRLAIGYHHEMGLLHDQLGQTELAFEHFTRANAYQFKDPAAKSIDPAVYLSALEKLAEIDLGDAWRPDDVSAEEPSPVFLVGFPRSGTTLLDQILDSHPSLQTLEETPIIKTLLNESEALAAEKAPDRETRRQLQARYFQLASSYVELKPGCTLVDKFPLNITRVPVIVRIFPNARFILALRHPLDVCLSCYMQPFGANEAMLNFARLDSTAQIYHHAMRLWLRCERELELRAHRIRYEDLVQDFDAEIGRLLAFLQLPWDDRVREFAAHAAGRGKINTPSYHQVTRQLNRDAVYRWMRYQRPLAPIVPVLAPYISEFGYEGDASAST